MIQAIGAWGHNNLGIQKHEKQKYQSSFRTRILVFQDTVFHVNNARYQIKKYLVKYDDACRFTLQNKYYKYI